MMGIEWLRPAAFFGSVIYAVIGVLVFWLSFIIIDKLTPVVGAMCLSVGMIVSSAIS